MRRCADEVGATFECRCGSQSWLQAAFQAAGRAESPMPHTFPTAGIPNQLVGRTPISVNLMIDFLLRVLLCWGMATPVEDFGPENWSILRSFLPKGWKEVARTTGDSYRCFPGAVGPGTISPPLAS